MHASLAPLKNRGEDPIGYARYLLDAMRRRRQRFPRIKSADPVWAMLLDLLVNSSLGNPISIESVCLASGAPRSTALRHLTALVARGDVVRETDPTDARRAFVWLSADMEARLHDYLSDEAERLARL